MTEHRQFAYTGSSPAKGYVGFVNIAETDNGVRFLVRSEGDDPPTASYEIPKHEAVRLLSEALKALAASDPGRPVPEHGSGP